MKRFLRTIERFFLRYRDRGIPNLMLYIVIGNVIAYFLMSVDPSGTVYRFLQFSREDILRGQVWRLVTYLFIPDTAGGVFGILITALMLFFLYRIGGLLEAEMGVCKFNCFYFCGVLLMDLYGILFRTAFSGSALSLSLFAAFATLYPNMQILLMYVIPIKAKYLAWVYLGLTVLESLTFRSLYPIIPLLNYLIFFASSLHNLLPEGVTLPKPKKRPNANWAKQYQSERSAPKPYTHKCTVCGRTNISDPQLEFRYCSRCNGYYCYCMEHINDHAHIE